MPIRSKPQQTSEATINALIEKGGSVATHEEPHAKTRNFQLRLNDEIRARIDRACKKRIVPPSWHAYIMEAVLQKLEVDERSE